MTDRSDRKLLILVVAYNAEKTIGSVLSRIPAGGLPAGTEVLIIDDASADRTFETAKAAGDRLAHLRLTVLCNPVNQGYGGNQKIGYQYAIDNGFSAVALLHGDGQYAPEKLPELAAPVLEGKADACFGSRMMEKGGALRGGMPYYKYLGNKILTSFQNLMLGLKMTEFHSGYRVYSVDALRRIPFSYNTNDFHFDTEIIIQLRLGGFRITELPIPTYYGGEICYVNGLGYAWNVFRTTLASRLHGMGICYQAKYDMAARPEIYRAKLGYVSSHTLAIDAVPAGSRVIDLACGPGHVAAELRKKKCVVTGLDKSEQDHARFDRFIMHDLDLPEFPAGLEPADIVLALDCLEHLDSPERLLADVRRGLYSESARIIITVPNVAFFVNRFGLLFGRFSYGARGILDLTHRRLFTFRMLRDMLEQEGYKITKMRGIPPPFPEALGCGRAAKMLMGLFRFLVLLWPGMFSYQIYAEAKISPTVKHLLARTLSFPGKPG